MKQSPNTARLLADALEREAATAEVLRVISRSPTDLQAVLDTIAEVAAKLCGASDALINQVRDGALVLTAAWGSMQRTPLGAPMPLDRGLPTARAVIDRRVVAVWGEPDEIEAEFPLGASFARQFGLRSAVCVPLLRRDQVIGAITIRRAEPAPFGERQVELLRAFADQAVIAIENARLFAELHERNRELAAALELQTATAEVLKVISGSPSDLRTVLDAIGAAAMRLCGAIGAAIWRVEGSNMRFSGAGGPGGVPFVGTLHPIEHGSVPGRAILERRVVHVADVTAAGDDFPFSAASPMNRSAGLRTMLAVPLLRGDEALGAISIVRDVVAPFEQGQIDLVTMFADQAVIAIENARLFHELQERLDEQTAIAEVLRTISQAPSDLDRLLATIAETGARLCGAVDVILWRRDGDEMYVAAAHGPLAKTRVGFRTNLLAEDSPPAWAMLERRPVHVHDAQSDPRLRTGLHRQFEMEKVRVLVAVPLLRNGEAVGTLTLRRAEPQPFSERQIALAETFATQAAIAVEHARLFAELAEKSHQLEVASRHKSEFLANMSHELRTPLNAILGYTELIADGIYGEVPPRAVEVLVRVQKSGQHLLGLINAVLDLSRIEAGHLVLAVEEYRLDAVVDAAISQVESLADEKRLRLRRDVAPDLPPGRGDERRLTQVLLNLLGNAIKFTEAGEVAVRASVSDRKFLVAVSDTGPGIAPSDQARIFEEFQQADDAAQKGGTGLGLAIARQIVVRHGGRMWLESTPGKGATFTFEVPIRAETPT